MIINHTNHYLGKTAKLTEMGVLLEKEYVDIFGFGNFSQTLMLYEYGKLKGGNEVRLMFIDERPIKRFYLTWYCLKEIGQGVHGDWHWFTLEQLLICN